MFESNINCTKTLLNSAKVPLKLWDSAILCSVYLYNINPHQNIDYKILNEVFSNRPVNITHLRVFGCKALLYNNHISNKFENNSKSKIFLGYASDYLDNKTLDLSTNSIISIRDVYFMEYMPGTINIPFFLKYIDFIINFKVLSIEVESNNYNYYNNNKYYNKIL